MRKKDEPVSGMNRRDFLKAGALAAGGLGAPLAFCTEAHPSTDAGEEKPFDSEVNGCCQFCQVRCTTKVQVKNGRVINVYGNPDNAWTQGGMCPKGQSMVELTYSPHRLLYPIKREGNGWKRISYQAIDPLPADPQGQGRFPEDYAHQVVLCTLSRMKASWLHDGLNLSGCRISAIRRCLHWEHGSSAALCLGSRLPGRPG
jgi:anaerobic selenocysteine-containing dehydrogenase